MLFEKLVRDTYIYVYTLKKFFYKPFKLDHPTIKIGEIFETESNFTAQDE